MSGSRPSGVPLSAALLAELDAGLLGGPLAARVRAAAAADPAATAALAALAATRAELAALPVPPIPDCAIDRCAAALRAVAATPAEPGAATPAQPTTATPVGPTTAPTRPGTATPAQSTALRPARIARRLRFLAAAALLLAVLVGPPADRPPDPTRHERIELATAGRSALGDTDLGPLADPTRRAGCLRVVGVLGLDPMAIPLGGRRVELARGPGVLLVFATGELGVFDVVVVDPGCGPAGGTLLGTARIGR